MPKSFKNYPNCRVIIDCTEIKCDTPSRVDERVLYYSSYKGGFTIKFLIGIAPNGQIIFVSKVYGGKAIDGFITNDSGFLECLESGDEILADKGFPEIRKEVLQRHCTLTMPPFAISDKPKFSKEEVLECYSVASIRIHIERAIQRIKTFKIFYHIYAEQFEYVDEIMYIACVLANNKDPLIAEE